jgi:hypothetical protein
VTTASARPPCCSIVWSVARKDFAGVCSQTTGSRPLRLPQSRPRRPGGPHGSAASRRGPGRVRGRAAAAEATRRILVESARKKRFRHGGRCRVDFQDVVSRADTSQDDLLALDKALTRLAARDPAKAELVKLRYFAGLSIDEAADLMGISRTTAKRYRAFARAWLYDAMTRRHENSEGVGFLPRP